MQEKVVSDVPDEADVRFLDGRTVLLHYAHLKSGKRSIKGCRLCVDRMGAILTAPKIEEPEVVVDKSDRADEERSTTSASGNGWPRVEEG